MCRMLIFNPALLTLLVLLDISRDIIKANNSKGLYTALGDSIACGYGALFYYGYTNYFFDYLKFLYPGSAFKNLGRPGITSNELLQQIKYNAKTRYFVKSSTIITISIGGNNLLNSTGRNYSIINTALSEIGIKYFIEDWSKILHLIRNELNSRAIIYVMNIYNPFRLDDPIFQIADHYINGINSVIMDPNLIKKFKYIPVDVYGYFKTDSLGLLTHFSEIRRNPHPTDEGHRQIARLHQISSLNYY